MITIKRMKRREKKEENRNFFKSRVILICGDSSPFESSADLRRPSSTKLLLLFEIDCFLVFSCFRDLYSNLSWDWEMRAPTMLAMKCWISKLAIRLLPSCRALVAARLDGD